MPGRIWVDTLNLDLWNDDDGRFRDILIGLGGDDYLNGPAAADLILGNDGDYTLDCDYSPDDVHGGPDDDLLRGRNGDDGMADEIDCGLRRVRVVARPKNEVHANCERVVWIAR